MPEIQREVRPIEVNYVCDACGKGMMSACGDMDPRTGAIDHRCLICNHQHSYCHSNTFSSMNMKANSHRHASQKSRKSPATPQ